MNQLIRLVYASRSVASSSPSHLGLHPGIARILAKSRKNNARLDVVGGLLFGEGYFLQCLEGDARVVQSLYSRIESDKRHRDVTVLLQSSISTRTFGAWSMKYVPGEQRLQALLRLWGVNRFEPYSLTKDQIDAAVRFMRDEEDAVDTVPSELQALPSEPAPLSKAPKLSLQRTGQPGAAASNQTVFLVVLAVVALTCAAAVGWLLLR